MRRVVEGRVGVGDEGCFSFCCFGRNAEKACEAYQKKEKKDIAFACPHAFAFSFPPTGVLAAVFSTTQGVCLKSLKNSKN